MGGVCKNRGIENQIVKSDLCYTADIGNSLTVNDYIRSIDRSFGFYLQDDWDNSGVQVCPNPSDTVTGVLLSSDLNFAVIDYAEQIGANLIITHHPLFMPFNAISSLSGGVAGGCGDGNDSQFSVEPEHKTAKDVASALALSLVQANGGKGITHIALHTNLDKAQYGIAHGLAVLFGLDNDSLEVVIPDTTSPLLGHGRVGNITDALLASFGGTLTVNNYAHYIKQLLNLPDGFIRINRTDLNSSVGKVAVLPGSGGEMITAARSLGANTVITADLKHHALTDENLITQLLGSDLAIIELPHNIMEFAAMTDNDAYSGLPTFYNILRSIDPNTPINIYDAANCCPWNTVI